MDIPYNILFELFLKVNSTDEFISAVISEHQLSAENLPENEAKLRHFHCTTKKKWSQSIDRESIL